MADTVYTVPDIYPEFRCKISSCRQTCCYGWEITLSMEEYFRLIGMNCPHALRHRLDGTVYILDDFFICREAQGKGNGKLFMKGIEDSL